jgi:hypothetical protein
VVGLTGQQGHRDPMALRGMAATNGNCMAGWLSIRRATRGGGSNGSVAVTSRGLPTLPCL